MNLCVQCTLSKMRSEKTKNPRKSVQCTVYSVHWPTVQSALYTVQLTSDPAYSCTAVQASQDISASYQHFNGFHLIKVLVLFKKT